MKVLVCTFNQEKALVGAFSVIVQLHRLIVYTALVARRLGAGVVSQHSHHNTQQMFDKTLQTYSESNYKPSSSIHNITAARCKDSLQGALPSYSWINQLSGNYRKHGRRRQRRQETPCWWYGNSSPLMRGRSLLSIVGSFRSADVRPNQGLLTFTVSSHDNCICCLFHEKHGIKTKVSCYTLVQSIK